VAKVSGLDVEQVWHRMPLAQGLQYIQIWWEDRDIVCEKVDRVSPLRRVID
jgi:hypothetical protein